MKTFLNNGIDIDYSRNQTKKIEKHFSNLNNLEKHFPKGEFKANKSGSKANFRFRMHGLNLGVYQITLTKTEKEDEISKTTILRGYAKDLGLQIDLSIKKFIDTFDNHVEVSVVFEPFKSTLMNALVADPMILNSWYITRSIAKMIDEVAYS